MFYIENDLFKAVHKYIKRTGSPGNYKYWYKLADGRVVAQDDQQESGKVEHLKRLIAGRMRGIHSKTNEQIASEIGVDKTKVGQHERNMRRPTSTTHTDFHESHLHEAHTDVNHESYEGHTRAVEAQHDSGSTPARVRSARASGSRETAPASTTSEGSTSTPARTSSRRTRTETEAPTPARAEASARESGGSRNEEPVQEQQANQNESQPSTERTAQAVIEEKRQKLKELFGIDLSAPASGASPEVDSSTSNQEPAPAPARPARQTSAERTANAVEELRSARQSVQRAKEAARSASLPTAPHATELRATDPVLDRDEADLAADIAEQDAGGNPYMTKAKSIFERISHNVKEDRRKTVGHLMQAMDELKEAGQPLNKQNLIEKYNTISGRRVRELGPIGDEFEKATFYSLDEVMNNPRIDPEVERMKRGYAAKQFARSVPFLKPSWLQGNVGAPPPFPTFGDFKTWSEHGGVKPEWAGNTKIAVPKEIFDAAHKSPDGKPKYPPADCPIHLMPAWNYAVKSLEKKKGTSIYESQNGKKPEAYANRKSPTKDQSSPTGWKLDFNDQAASGRELEENGPEGHFVNALRKYVKMRGGANQLTDIPQSKLAEANLTHADIYKGESDDPYHIMKTKIIDPIALVPFIKEEVNNIKKPIKKSVVFVVDGDAIFKSSPKRDEAEILKKAELINKIKKLKNR